MPDVDSNSPSTVVAKVIAQNAHIQNRLHSHISALREFKEKFTGDELADPVKLSALPTPSGYTNIIAADFTDIDSLLSEIGNLIVWITTYVA